MKFELAIFAVCLLRIASAVPLECASRCECPALHAFQPGEVTVGGEVGRRMDVTMEKILHHTDIENVFARPFKVRKEKPDEPGGFAGYGMFLDALVKGAAHGIGGAESIGLKTRLLRELAATQTADGQISMFLKEPGFWDNHDNAYMIQAFVNDYRWFGTTNSLRTAMRLADSLIAREAFSTIGTETAFALLGGVTHERRYIDYLRDVSYIERPIEEFDAKLQVNNVGHVYSWLARAIGQMDYADLVGKTSSGDRAYYGAPAAEAMRRAHGPYLSVTGSITGTAHWAELWDDSQIGIGKWGETCASAYLMRLVARMSEWEADCGNFDLYERVLYNAFFSAQSEDGLKYRYFTPFNCRAPWWNRDTYCCPNNYRRMMFEVPDSVFRRAKDGLAVCLYASAELKSADMSAKMSGNYPDDGSIELDVRMKHDEKSLYLRIPKWCTQARVTVDGSESKAGPGWFRIRRDFENGVKVRLDMPMPVRLVKGCRAQEGRFAVMRGPCVYALEPELNGLKPGGNIDLWDIQTSDPLVWDAEKKAVRAVLRFRYKAHETRPVLLTRYHKEDRVRTYFQSPTSCTCVSDEITSGLSPDTDNNKKVFAQ